VVEHVILLSLVIAGLIVLRHVHRTVASGATQEPAR
jgi:hypothetical protein